MSPSLPFLLFLHWLLCQIGQKIPNDNKSLAVTNITALLYNLKCCKVIADMETWMALFPVWLPLDAQDGVLADPMKAAIVLG